MKFKTEVIRIIKEPEPVQRRILWNILSSVIKTLTYLTLRKVNNKKITLSQ